MAGTIHPLPTDIGPNYLSGDAGKRFFTPGVRIRNDGGQQLVVCCRGCKQEVDDSCNVTDKTIKKPSQTWNGSGNGTYKNRLGNALNKYKGRHRDCTVEVRRRSNTSSYIFIHPLQSFLLILSLYPSGAYPDRRFCANGDSDIQGATVSEDI